MEAAYDDKAGVSAAFAKNLLLRLQRDPRSNWTRAIQRQALTTRTPRIAMALVTSSRKPGPSAPKRSIRAGEALITEYSYKYAR